MEENRIKQKYTEEMEVNGKKRNTKNKRQKKRLKRETKNRIDAVLAIPIPIADFENLTGQP